MGRDLQAIGRSVEGVFATYCWLKTNESKVRFGWWLRPGLQVFQDILAINGEFGDGQYAFVGDGDGHAMRREWVRIVWDGCVPVEGMGIKAWKPLDG